MMNPAKWCAKCFRVMSLAISVTIAIAMALSPGQAASQAPPGKFFLGPPVPVASQAYSIRVYGTTSGGPITVENITVDVTDQVVDVTFYLHHASDITSIASYQGTVAGPPLAAGVYTFRLFTRARYFALPDYSAPALAFTTPVIVTSADNVSDAVEYYYPALNHYFTTALPAEIAALDAGVFPGWSRTGEKLSGVYLTDPSTGGVQAPVTPVCRFYGLPSAGLDTHFFSASPAECAAVAAKWPGIWLLETMTAFYVYPANTTEGSCPDGTVPVYRVYNNRPDANHRYTTSIAIRDSMVQAGWIPEGYGPNAVAFCIPQ